MPGTCLSRNQTSQSPHGAELDWQGGEMSQESFLTPTRTWLENGKESKKSKSCLSRDQGWACDVQAGATLALPSVPWHPHDLCPLPRGGLSG